MKVALIGYGKMGQTVEAIAPTVQVDVVARLRSKSTEVDWRAIEKADACIDFSHPDAVVGHIERAARFQIPMVIGTTGWYRHMDKVKAMVNDYGLGIIYAQNFSLGMNLFIRVVAEAARLLNRFDGYDVAVSEMHHRRKVDSPSGTAYAIAEALMRNMSRKHTIHDNCNERKQPDALHISSLRVGSVPGTHTVIFDSLHETMTLTHQAHDSSAWAEGALEAAKWIQNKKGFFDMNAMMEEFSWNSQDL
ncbi:MAG: 4-hydroxy-tetrahydrodipicolinate reductase [Waddliaceae bacterium]